MFNKSHLEKPIGGSPADIADAIAKKHDRQHSITSTSDHTSTATAGKILKADASGLPVDATNTDSEVSETVTHKYPFWQILTGETVTVPARQQYSVYSRLDLQGTISLLAGAELAVHS